MITIVSIAVLLPFVVGLSVVYSAHETSTFEQQYFPTSHNFIAGITNAYRHRMAFCVPMYPIRSHGIHTWYSARESSDMFVCIGIDWHRCETRERKRDPNVNTIFHTASGVVFLPFDIVRSVFRRPFAWKHCLRCCAHRIIFVFYKHKYSELKHLNQLYGISFSWLFFFYLLLILIENSVSFGIDKKIAVFRKKFCETKNQRNV